MLWCFVEHEQVDVFCCVLDVDECATHADNCEVGCVNTDGSFQCTCNEGYKLQQNGHSCEGR